MLCKYYLQLGSYTINTESPDCMDVSSMIKNLDSIKVSYARVDLGGVVRKCGSSLEFTGKAYEAIIAHYEENYLQSKGVFAVYMADNNWYYTKVWECPLDFATLQYDANVLSIGCVDNSAAAIIKANKKSKYEFEVSSIKDQTNLLYNGVQTQRSFIFNVVGKTNDGTSGSTQYSDTTIVISGDTDCHSLYSPHIGVSGSGFDSDSIAIRDQDACYAWSGDVRRYWDEGPLTNAACYGSFVNDDSDDKKVGFIKALKNCVVHIRMNFNMRVRPGYTRGDAVGTIEELFRHVEFYYILVAGNRVIWRKRAVVGDNQIDINMDCQLNKDEFIAFVVSIRCVDPNYTWNLFGHDYFYMFDFEGFQWEANNNTAYVNESQYDDNPIEINAIKPITLMNRLVNKMFEGHSEIPVQCVIDGEGSLLPRTLLLSAESIRRISTNKLYTSFSDFCKFMEVVYGYVFTLENTGDNLDKELWLIIRKSLLTSPSMNPAAPTTGYYKMLPVGGYIDEDVGDALDLTTPFSYAIPEGCSYNSYLENILYDSIHNIFVVWDVNTEKYYANFTMENAIMLGSWYNENGHAKEMIGLNIATFFQEEGDHLYGIIRNGELVVCSGNHSKEWLDTGEDNQAPINLTFRHRNKVFASNVIKTLQHVSNLSYQFDESLAFSDIEVGYKKQDYDNNNSAINEFNFTNNYKTDCDISENTLSLISPYRADCYGIEELLVKSGEDESTDSDNDIFVVIASASYPENGYWQIDRSITVQNAYSQTVFNAAIAPNKIILNNEEYIGSSAKALKFTSSDANSSAIIGGTPMSSNINITKQLFKAGKISIDTDDYHFPENWDGLIEFAYGGKTYKGYLDSIDICFANTGTITYNIIEKCIE